MTTTCRGNPPSFLASITSTLKSTARTIYLSLRTTAFVLPWLTHLFLADLVLSFICLPLTPLLPTSAYNLSSSLAYSVWSSLQRIFTQRNNASITVSGLSGLPPPPPHGREDGESAIVIANHVEWTDVYMIQELAVRQGMLGRCRWFAKRELKWVPFLGWGLWAMGMPMVSRKWVNDKKEMERVFSGITDQKWPICMYSVPAKCKKMLLISNATPPPHHHSLLRSYQNVQPL